MADAANETRQPRAVVLVDGVRVDGWIDWAVENNAFFTADVFRVSFARSNLPAGRDAAWWSAQARIEIEIRVGFPGDPERFDVGGLASLIIGRVDDVTDNPVTGVLDVTGRDLSADLMDAKTTEKWPNRTASQIAEDLAARHGLQALAKPSTTPAGRYYQIDNVQLTDEATEWDLLTYLARQERAMVFLRGRTLVFGPRDTGAVWPLHWTAPDDDRPYAQSGALALNCARNLTLARDIIVKVRSWNAKQKTAFEVEARATRSKNKIAARGAAYYAPQIHTITVPGLTREQALQRAQAELAALTQHEMRIGATLPGDVALTTASTVRVSGLGTAFDQDYFPDRILRRMSIDEGFQMELNAKNHSPESVAVA